MLDPSHGWQEFLDISERVKRARTRYTEGMADDTKRKSEADPKQQDAGQKQRRPAPAPKKIREAKDNLQRREEWFRKRAG